MKRTRRTMLAVAAAVLAMAAVAPAAEARSDGHRGRHDNGLHQGQSYRHQERYDRYRDHRRVERQAWVGAHIRYRPRFGTVVVAPRVIVPAYRDAFAPYVYDRVWVPAHRHYHVIYRFPVDEGGRIVYRPYAYCGDRVYATGSFSFGGPSFRLDVRF